MEKKTKILAVLFLALMLCMSSCSGCSGCDKIKKIIGVLTDQETTESASESGSETEDESSASDEETDESSDVASGKESDKESSKKESGSKKENDGISASGGSKEKSEEESSEETEKESSEETTKESASESSSETEKASETAHTHTFKHVAKVDPTCEKDGNIEYWQCTECYMCFKDAEGKNYISKPEDLVLKGGHKLNFHKGYVSTSCLVETTLGYFDCERCGKRFLDEEAKTEVKSDADLKVPGPHNLVEVPAKTATCVDAGNTQYWECSYCGKYFTDKDAKTEIASPTYVIVYPLGHDLEEVFAYPTCFEDGYVQHWECKRCGKWFEDPNAVTEITNKSLYIMPAEHSWDWRDEVSAPCGHTLGHFICTECGAVADSYYIIHSADDFYTYYNPSGSHDWQRYKEGGHEIYDSSLGGYLYECTYCRHLKWMDPKG